ncbi:MAG: hypothetical protein CMJ53_06050 [Planctomycetaceae bacterium]|mgnify:CR=1 FL=1|nr:hypothetical protein [Planctomycetaceae bacterium]
MSWRSVVLETIGGSWNLEFWPVVLVLIVSSIYLRGFIGAHRSTPERFPIWRAGSFILGQFLLLYAILSPLDELGGFLLSAHMIQHLLMLGVVPPLILMGAPGIPMLRGLPATVRKDWLGPFLADSGVQSFFRVLVHPITGWLGMVLSTWLWHVSFFYELALVDPFWHEVEHACFLFFGVLFWFPVIQPWPTHSIWPRWAMIPYLLLADIQNTIFSAFFSFAPGVIYPVYSKVSPAFGVDPLQDQALAGGIMWVPGSIIFIAPVALVIRDLMKGSGPDAQRRRLHGRPVPQPVSLPQFAAPARRPRGFDLLTVPVLGRVLGSRRGRHALRFMMLLLAVVVIVDGFAGPRVSSMNLAGVLPWTHWRGLAVLVLLFGGNLLCMACPFTLPRSLAGRFLPRKLAFPKALRTKWLAAFLLVIWLWAYEVLALWDAPGATAWIIIGYFVAAFSVDAFFRGASFCKYVCPIGQFHFVQSMVSPMQVSARDASVCADCTTHECIRGNGTIEGCGSDLFMPKKVGNLDCTFCLDCADACPKDNIGIKPNEPGSDLSFMGWRSSLGALSERRDVIALLLVLIFGGFANAAGMTSPVIAFQDDWSQALGQSTHFLMATILLSLQLLVIPALAVLFIMVGMRLTTRGTALTEGTWVAKGVLSLVPLGAAMWIVHYQFHLMTSWLTILPVSQRALLDVSGDALLPIIGEPAWSQACCLPPPDWLLMFELVLLNAGFVFSFVLGFRHVRDAFPSRGTLMVFLTSLPLLVVQAALFFWGCWIVFQPMQMRGTLLP